MRTIKIVIPKEESEMIERFSYEITTRQNVVDRYIEKHKNDETADAMESECFKYFLSKLTEAEAGYELSKNEITKKYIPESIKMHDINWDLDFYTNVLTIKIMCNCKIEGYDNA